MTFAQKAAVWVVVIIASYAAVGGIAYAGYLAALTIRGAMCS